MESTQKDYFRETTQEELSPQQIDFNLVDQDNSDISSNEAEHEYNPMDEKTYHFYWLVNKAELNTNYTLRFKNILAGNKSTVNMIRRDDNLYYAEVSIRWEEFEELTELKYSYVKNVLQESLDQNEESEQDRSKGKKFLRLNTFFDSYKTKILNTIQSNKNEVHEFFIKFFIKNSNKEDMHFGKAKIFLEYIEYLKEEGNSFPYSMLFKILLQEYQLRSADQAFNLYIIELLSYIDVRTIKKKNKYIGPLVNEMQKQAFGYFRKLLFQDSQKGFKDMNMIRGIVNLYTVNPLIGLQFFDDKDVIPHKQEFLNSIELKDQSNFYQLKNHIQQCYQDPSFNKDSLKHLIEYVLSQSRDLETFLATVEELQSYAEPDSIEKSIRQLKNRFQRNQVKDFVKVNLERTIRIKSIQKILRKEIQDQIYINLQRVSHSDNLQFLFNNPQLLDIQYLLQIVEIKSNLYLQSEFKRIFLSFLTYTTEKQEFSYVKDVLVSNFKNLIKDLTFDKSYIVLSNFIDLTNEPYFTKVYHYSQESILKQIKKSMSIALAQYPIKFLLEDLIKILNYDKDTQKTNHIIQVALEIIQKIDINEITIKLVLENLFQNDKIIYEDLRQISEFIFSKLQKLKPQLQPSSIFDDELLYISLKISINYQDSDFLISLNKKVMTFAEKIKDKSIYLKEVNQIIVNKKKYLEQMLTLVQPDFNLKLLDELVQINQQYKEKVDKHQIFLNWALKSNMAVDIKNYEKEINKIRDSFDNLTAAKACSQDYWLYFQKFKNIEKYYHFRYSKLFENLFLTMSQETGKNQHIGAFQEEEKRQQSLSITASESMVKLISMEMFDKTSSDILFGRICKDHFNCLMKYPEIPLKQEKLTRYWSNISPTQVLTELQYVLEYELKIMDFKDISISMDLSDHLQKYGNLLLYFQRSIILISLEAFARKQKLFNLDEDQNFIKLKKYVEFVSQRNQEIDLIVIALEVTKVQHIFLELEKNKQVKWEILEELSKSKDTFEFSIANIGLDFNDLFERLDEDSFITNATISDMNTVSNYFNHLYLKIQELQGFNGFLQLLEFFSNDLQTEIQQEQNFKSKLQNCNTNLSAIKQIADATKNVAENTLQIIADCLQYGQIIWTKDKDKFDYHLKVNYEAKEKENDESSSLQEQHISQQLRSVIFDQDKVNQHCSRAILLIHSKKTNPNQQQQIEEDVNLFAQIVAYGQEINSLLRDLSQYGQTKYKEDQLKYVRQISRETIQEELNQLQNTLKNDLQEWKERLHDLRQMYYFLTYVPNSMIANLIDCFENPNNESLETTVRDFKKYKMLHKDTQDNILNSQKDNLYEIFQKIWAAYIIEIDTQLRQKMNKIQVQFQLQASKVQHRYVTDDISLIKAILSLFTISGVLPQSTDILFCTELTQINEIETFVMRAMLCSKQIGRPKLFIMVNFQKLSFTIQNQCYDFIKTQEQKYSQISSFYLYLISVCQDIKSAHLIEEERSSASHFQQYIKEEQLREVFKKFDSIKVVKSEQCGLGKSEFIKTTVLKNEKTLVRIPICGELNRQKLIELHQKRILSNRSESELQNIAIHYDIYPTTKEELNIIMFELLILSSLSDYQNNTFYLPENIKIFIEISQSLNDEFNFLFFTYLKTHDCKWDFTNIIVGNDKNDKVQKVCRYLHALEEQQKYRPELLIDPPTIFSEFECQMILKKHVVSRLKDPNFYYINSFVTFVSDQINRMEESIFFRPENLQNQMTGWFGAKNKAKELHKEIVKQLVQLAHKIAIVEKYQEQTEMLKGISKQSTIEEQANRFKDLQWDVYNNPFIVFNDSGTITPIFKNLDDVPKAIVEYQERANKRDKEAAHLKKYDELTNDDFIEKILEICVDEAQKEKLRKQKDLKNIVFTLDNFMKLVLIYLRIRAYQPIILMGETGVGKTSLVEYLAKIIDAEFRVLNVHAGITEQEIIKFVEESQELASLQEERGLLGRRKIILFFDEINTNYNISGLLKEIFIDRHLNGEPLRDNISLVSACNPYKLRKQEVSGQTSGIRISDKDTSLSKLVYRVLPLPESMIPFIWDYKSLNEEEEKKYITKMVEKTYENAKIIGKGISLVNLWVHKLESEKQKVYTYNQEIRNISMIVQKSQTYIKKEEDSPWAVSLRDVSRFCKLFVYFYKNNATTDSKYYNPEKHQILRQVSPRDISMILAIYFCYVIRISVYKKRIEFINYLSQITIHTQMSHLDTMNFISIILREQDRFLDQMELKAGIGKNAPLKENIFVMITCILNQIPLIITGKPGSSKTLAMNLINKSFKGSISSKDFFKRFPAFLTFYYQGSEQSTSKGIERIYKKAHKTQKKVREKNTQVVVIFDEIGLAEKSPHNPLKVLHSLLEPPKVATVGISNWSLDASKMNRVITLSRTDPDHQDLYESAKSIAKDANPIFGNKYLNSLVQWYIQYIQRQETTQKCRNFHGLRDFYSMIKFISSQITDDEDQNEMTIVHGIQRNFGGVNFEVAFQTLQIHLQLKNQDLLKKIKPDQLIKDNLVDYESRHLMIITDNFENTLQFIQDECQSRQRQYEIFYGSDFPDDQNEESIYKQINEIILQMENGTLCIFLNLNSIYQSFYDMLNQNYQEIGNQRFCKVAIGPDSSRCLVHEKFKCILIVDHDKIDELDPPLLNRFEKQLFTEEISIDSEQKIIISKLNAWISNMQVKNFSKRQMLPTIDDQQSLQQLVIQNKELYEFDVQRIEKECKRALIRVSTFQGIIRSQDSDAQDKQEWYLEYINVQHHYNLHKLLKHYLNSDDQSFKKTQGFNVIVYTFQAMILMIENDKKIKAIEFQEKLINLSSIHKKKQFQQKIENFFSNSNPNRLLLIYADMLSDSKNRINLCRSIINNQRTKRLLNRKDGEELKDKNICFIVRIDQHRDDQNISYGKDWIQYTVDLLNGKGQTEISSRKLIKSDFETLIRLASSQTSLFETSIVESMSKIYYNKNQEFIKERIYQIQALFQNEDNIEYLRQLILLKVKQNENFDQMNSNWRLQVAKNEFLMKSNLTFHGAALEYIKTELVKYLAFIIFYLEQDGIINAHNNNDLFILAQEYFKNLFRNNYINNRIQDMYFLAQNFDRIKFPLARLIHQQFMQLKIQYIKILKEQATQEPNGNQNNENQNGENDHRQSIIEDGEEHKDDKLAIAKIKSLKVEKAKQERLRKVIIKDKQLIDNIQSLEQWVKIYFPQDYIDQKILAIDNSIYADDFSYLLDNQDIITQNTFHQDYNRFIKISLSLIMKEKFESKSQIYGVYWKYENMLTTVWKIIKDNIKLFEFQQMNEKLEKEIKSNEYYLSGEVTYTPRESFLVCLIKVFYQLYYPSELHRNRFNLWEQNVKQTFQKLNDLAFYYLHVQMTHESRVIMFLLKFNQEILSKSKAVDQEIIFINLAQSIKDIFNNPEQIITTIFNLKDQLLKDQDTQYKITMNRKIFKFVCEYIIDADEEGDEIELEFLINNIITLFIQTGQDLQECLQYDEKFKFIMLKLIYIALYQIEEPKVYIKALINDNEKYEEFLEDNEELQVLNNYISENTQLSFSDPFIIALTDQIEENMDEDQCLKMNKIETRLLIVQQILLNDEAPLLQKIIAVAFFKKVTQAYCQDLSLWIDGQEQFEAVTLQQAMRMFFDVSTGEKKQQLLPFLIYILKLLYQQHDVLKMDQSKLLEKNKWIKEEYLDLRFVVNQKNFSFINIDQFKQYRQEAYTKIANIDEMIKMKELHSFKKFSYILTLIEYSYLQGKPIDTNTQFKLLGNLETDQFQPNSVVTDRFTRDFLTPFITNEFEVYQMRNKFIKIESEDKLFYCKMLYMFLGAATLSGKSFLNEFFTNPKNIKEYYIPFVQNIKDDFDYQQKLQNNEHVVSIQCQHCKQMTLVVDLSMQGQDAAKSQEPLIVFGEKKCQFCKTSNEDNRNQEVNKNIKNSKFSTNDLALKSYIPFDQESYSEIKIRNLSSTELAIGRIVLHSLLWLSLSFSTQNLETEIFSMVLSDYPYSNNEYGTYLTRTIKYLTFCMQKDWNKLKNNLGINDEKILQIIEYIIIEMVRDIGKFQVEQLKTIQGRMNFEKAFAEICRPIFQDLNGFFNSVIGYENDIEKLLLEFNEVQNNEYYHLLRIKSKISIQQFESYLNQNNRDDQSFFKLLFEQKESIQSIQYLKPLVTWAKYIFNKWNAQLTYDEANELTIRDIIERENLQNKGNKDYILKIEKDFAKFQHAWNKFQGLIIRDQNVEVTIPIITQSSKLIHCCLTSEKQDQQGHIFYVLLKYLALKQNQVLESATKMIKQKNQNQMVSIEFQDPSLLDIRKEQIIYFRERPAKTLKRRNTTVDDSYSKLYGDQKVKKDGDREKEKFQQIIIDNSACNLKYGQGKIVEYNIESIKNSSFELLLQGKHKIDLNQKLNFQFVNIGNLYSQFEDISKKVKQEQTDLTKSILEKKTIEEAHTLLGQLRVTMNFIQNSLIKDKDDNFPEKPILEFMRALKIIDNDQHLGSDLKLKHIICLYEAVEERVEHIEVEKINQRYQVKLHPDDKQFIILGKLINEKKEHTEKLMHIVGRLCIRQLRNFSKDLTDQKLFIFLSQKPQLFTKHCENLKDGEQSNDRKEIQALLEDFYRCTVDIKHAKDVYLMLRQQYEKMEHDKKVALENEKKRIQQAQNGKQVGDINLNDIVRSLETDKNTRPKKKKEETKEKKPKKKKGRIERIEDVMY